MMTIQIPILQRPVAKFPGPGNLSIPIDKEGFILHRAAPSAASRSPNEAC
jgi:hypothetical protein